MNFYNLSKKVIQSQQYHFDIASNQTFTYQFNRFYIILQAMGNICTNNFEKQQTTETVDSRNSIKISVALGNHCSIDLITGNFRQHKSDSLLVITQAKSLEHSEPLREYVNEADKTIQAITSQRKMFYKAPVNKSCPYKKLLLAILPKYLTQQSQQYQQHFKNILKQVLGNSKDITIQFVNTIEGIHQLPNQMILAILFKQLQDWKNNVKINLITNQKKMMNMYKYELLKTQNCKLRYHQEGVKESM